MGKEINLKMYFFIQFDQIKETSREASVTLITIKLRFKVFFKVF